MAKKREKRADGRYEIKRKMPDGKYKHFLGRTVAEATAKYEAAYREAVKQAVLYQGGATYREMSTAYKDYITSPAAHIKRGTLNSYLKYLPQLLAYFGDTPMREIDTQAVCSYLEKMKLEGKALHTITNAKSVLSCVFNYWCANYHGTGNPVLLAAPPSGMKKGTREEPTEEQWKIINAHPDGCGFWAQLFEYTGLRLGEANGLQWQDVDLNRNLIHVQRAMPWDRNHPYLETPKSEKGYRDVPILSPIRDTLARMKAEHAPSDYVLSGGPEPLTQTQYEYRWMMYCRPLGLCIARVRRVTVKATASRPEHVINKTFYKATVTAHQFRHFYASNLFYAGVPDIVAQQLMGHADIMTTRRIYQHLREKENQQFIDRLDTYVAEQKRKVCKKSALAETKRTISK